MKMNAGTGFDTNAPAIKPGFTTTLDKISRVLNQYGKTAVTVIGRTDNVGSDAFNQTLSEKRAQSVLDYFASRNVNPARLEAHGKGESEPRADNATEAGRQLDRRVGLAIEREVTELFRGCDPGAIPATGAAYRVDVIVDDALLQQPDVYFEAGDHEALVHMSCAQFGNMLAGSPHGRFTHHV